MLNLVCVVLFVVILVEVLEDLALSNTHECCAHSESCARAVGYVHQPAVWNLLCVLEVLVVVVMILEDCPGIAPLHLLETSLGREEVSGAAACC